MHSGIRGILTFALVCWTGQVQAQDIEWRPARSTPAGQGNAPAITLGKPQSISSAALESSSEAEPAAPISSYVPLAVVRAQGPDGPPPPPPPGGGFMPPPPPGPSLGEEAYNCGVANAAPGAEGFFPRLGEGIKKCWTDVTGGVVGIGKPGPGGRMFQSDHCFDVFISPVSNPYFFEDPRALTELRPIFMWQRTPGSNPIFAGGDNFALSLQGRLALTPNVSIVVNKLGFIWMEPENGNATFSNHFGIQELALGPKWTFWRNDRSNTVAALGVTFDIPIGPAKVFQDTGDLSIIPYFSIAQNFFRSSYGSFNFMNTTGYSFGIDNQRTDFFFASFHLDYDIGNLKKLYPLVELNWAYYTQNGGRQALNFEGRDLFNFGSNAVSGLNELTLALGARYKVSEALQFGLTGEFSLLSGGRHMDRFRLTADVIWRYEADFHALGAIS